MPLYELYRMVKANANSSQDLNPPCSREQSSLAENDLCELVWENGQILNQGHSNTPKRAAASKSLPSQCLPSYSPRARDRHVRNNSHPRSLKFGEFQSVIDDIPMSLPSSNMGLHQDEDLVPWFSYAMNHHSQNHGYSSDLLPELSAVTSHELPNRNNFSLIDKRSNDSHSVRNSHKHYGHDGGTSILDCSSSQPCQSSSLQAQTSITSLRPRELEIQNKESNGQSHLFSDNLTQVRSTRGFSDFKMQTQDLKLPSRSSTTMNFSHFAHPTALMRNNVKTIGATCGLSSARTDAVASNAMDFAARSKHLPTSTPIESNNGNANNSASQATDQPSKVDLPPMESKHDHQRAAPVKQSEPVGQTDGAKDEQVCSQVPLDNTRKGVTDDEKSIEPAVASSVCSWNNVEKASEDPVQHKKRRTRDNYESEGHSEDAEEESMDVKKLATARGGLGSKRSRAAEVHNLSERRRRDRINEKMRALQELIPNCNKVDKASMLDEAIEYLKTLQLQVQMMSVTVGAGLYMPQMMFPTVMQHMHTSHMPPFSPMGVEMHMGFGMGYGMVMPDNSSSSSAYPMMQLPTVRGTHFPAPSRLVQPGLHGMTGSNLEVFGQPSQGLPVSMSDAPLVSGALLMKSMKLNAYEAGGRTANMESASVPATESTVQMISQVTLTTGANEELNQITNQATSPVGYLDVHAQEVNDIGTCSSGKDDGAEPSCD